MVIKRTTPPLREAPFISALFVPFCDKLSKQAEAASQSWHQLLEAIHKVQCIPICLCTCVPVHLKQDRYTVLPQEVIQLLPLAVQYYIANAHELIGNLCEKW